MSSTTQTPADIALAAWQAAGIKPPLLHKYKRRWNTWQEWCDAKGIDPLGATCDDFTLFLSEHNFSPEIRRLFGPALCQPYLYVNKPPPGHRPTVLSDKSKSHSIPVLQRFETWSKANHVTNLPARQEDVIAFLTEFAKRHPKTYVEDAAWLIGRMHTDAGFASPTRGRAFHAAMKNLQGTPKQLVADTECAKNREARIVLWKDWCLTRGIDPAKATAADFLKFLKELATRLSFHTLIAYRHAIASMYEDRSTTHNPETQALIDATPTAAERKAQPGAVRQIVDAEIQLLLRTEARLMEPFNSHLPTEKRERIARAMAHADVTDETLRGYVAYAWLPFKAWCPDNETSPETATPGDVSAFLCEVADEKGTTYAESTFNGLLYVFRRIRPTDNPADVTSVRKTLRGLKRERPNPHKQAQAIGTKELAILVHHAPNPKPREFPDQTDLRSAVDIALLHTMHDTGMRGGEAAAVEFDDLLPAPDGLGGSILIIRKSKTDQLHEGTALYLTRVTTDAIQHMKNVRQELGIPDDDPRIFRLNESSIYRRIKAACKHAGLIGRYTMHSLRIGTSQDLLIENFSDAQIMNVLRWKSPASLTHYTKHVAATKNAVAQREERRKLDGYTRKPRRTNYGIRAPHSKARLGH